MYKPGGSVFSRGTDLLTPGSRDPHLPLSHEGRAGVHERSPSNEIDDRFHSLHSAQSHRNGKAQMLQRGGVGGPQHKRDHRGHDARIV